MPYSPLPCDERLPSSSSRPLGHSQHPAARPSTYRPCPSLRDSGHSSPASVSPRTYAAPDSLRSAPGSSLRLRERLFTSSIGLTFSNSFLKQLQSLVATLCLKVGHGLIKDALRGRLLTAPHHAVNELRYQRRSIDRIGWNFTLGDKPFSRHLFFFLVFPQRG